VNRQKARRAAKVKVFRFALELQEVCPAMP